MAEMETTRRRRTRRRSRTGPSRPRRAGAAARTFGSTATPTASGSTRRFILADEPFTIDNEEMTPSMKIRRHVIRKRYADRMDALYKG